MLPCDTGEEKNFQIPKPGLRLKHTWEFIFKEICRIYNKSYLTSGSQCATSYNKLSRF